MTWPKPCFFFFSLAVLGGFMQELFDTESSIVVGVFRCLVDLDRKKNSTDRSLQSLLENIWTILLNRSHLACVCRQWSEKLSSIQTLSLPALHFNAFGCCGNATEIFARYVALNNCHIVACSHEPFLCEPTIVKFFSLPWRLRMAKLGIFCQQSQIFTREMFEAELAQPLVQNLFSAHTIALVERAFAAFPLGANVLARRPQTAHRYSNTVYELLNFRSGYQHEVTPDEFVASFKNSNVYTRRHLDPEPGASWPVRTIRCHIIARLTSVLCSSPQVDHEVHGTCSFTFQNQSFGVTMRVLLGSKFDLTLDFITIPNL